jgi:7-cyano-7-deazaguanine synthase
MVLETSNKEKNRNKKVLLFSGGLDCLCTYHIYQPDIVLHINYGGKYGEIEKQTLKELIRIGAIDKNKVIEYDIGEWLGERERDDLIIPNRNAYFVLLASELGEEIWLASVKGDRSFDKDNTFYQLIQDLLNHMWDSQHWTERREFKIKSPVKDKTKVQLIQEFIKAGGKTSWLLKSYSCYKGEEKPCGKCKPCLRKAIALYNCNVFIPEGYFQNNPRDNKGLRKLKQKIVYGEYRGKEEDREICNFMEWRYIGK